VVKLKGYALSKHNATKHGVFSKNTVMEWENKEDYDSLVDCLVEEYQPKHISEIYLVEELASVMWRKNRLRYSENTQLQTKLNDIVNHNYSQESCINDALLEKDSNVYDDEVKSSLTASTEAIDKDISAVQSYKDICSKVIKILNKTNSYEDGFKLLPNHIQNEWEDEWKYSKGDISDSTAEGLFSWLEEKKETYDECIYHLENKDKIKAQVIGNAFMPNKETDQFIRCENHLDRKFEKTLSMLVKLQELKSTKDANLAKSVL
jgi:hypothetical protein